MDTDFTDEHGFGENEPGPIESSCVAYQRNDLDSAITRVPSRMVARQA